MHWELEIEIVGALHWELEIAIGGVVLWEPEIAIGDAVLWEFEIAIGGSSHFPRLRLRLSATAVLCLLGFVLLRSKKIHIPSNIQIPPR